MCELRKLGRGWCDFGKGTKGPPYILMRAICMKAAARVGGSRACGRAGERGFEMRGHAREARNWLIFNQPIGVRNDAISVEAVASPAAATWLLLLHSFLL